MQRKASSFTGTASRLWVPGSAARPRNDSDSWNDRGDALSRYWATRIASQAAQGAFGERRCGAVRAGLEVSQFLRQDRHIGLEAEGLIDASGAFVRRQGSDEKAPEARLPGQALGFVQQHPADAAPAPFLRH